MHNREMSADVGVCTLSAGIQIAAETFP